MRAQDKEGGLTIDCDTSTPGMAMVRLVGSLDAHTYERAEEQIDDLIAGGHCRVAVDASGLQYVSSAGIGVFIGALARTRKENGNLILVNASKALIEVLAVLGVDSMFFNAPDRVTALAFLGRR
jgi:anti-sigma B factor antagonist